MVVFVYTLLRAVKFSGEGGSLTERVFRKQTRAGGVCDSNEPEGDCVS